MKFIFIFLAFVAGMGITTQVAVNGKLQLNVGNPILTSLFSFSVGTLVLALACIVSVYAGNQTIPAFSSLKETNWWMWVGGILGAFYIFVTIIAAPKIGFASMFSLIIAGQVILAVILDHLGVLGNVQLLSPLRIVGVVLLIAAVYIIQTH
ncbi:DMT family transporter [Bacillota bacterium LX-D]|nr:DMT family transporter [Bacillota bacterium LX-D]